jgi:uncharacterized protein (DUF427 family)
MKAIWNNEILAEADQTLVVEGKHYFPQQAVKLEYLSPSEYCEECPVKGLAKYYNLEVAEQALLNAAWYYPNPKEEAVHITGFIAFSDVIQVVD